MDIFGNLLSLKYFSPDEWLDRLSKAEMGTLLVKGPGIPDWLHKRYKEAAYAYVYGFFNASVALCRSIIEVILKNKLESMGVLNRPGFLTRINVFRSVFPDHSCR